jgi:aminoglycoside phosphotransferase (APT) family kinase protein
LFDTVAAASVSVVTHRIHDEEPDTSEAIVSALLAAECPRWSGLPLAYLETSGTSNALWRVSGGAHPDAVVRLPRRPDAAEKVAREAELLSRLSTTPLVSVVSIPKVLHVGEPHEVFPHRWSVFGWLDGTDAWTTRTELGQDADGLAADLGEAVLAIGELGDDLPAPARQPGERGGPIEALVQRLNRWLDDPRWRAVELIDVARVRDLAAEALEVEGPATSCFVHGDLIPGNLLLRSGRLSAILDWAGAGYGDPAQDLAPAWSMLSSVGRQRFRTTVGADDAAWIRARTIELEHAVGGVLYYVPRRHILGDIQAATLARILEVG